MFAKKSAIALAALALVSQAALAFAPADAGRILQEQAQPLPAPMPSPAFRFDLPPEVAVQPGGPKVRIDRIRIEFDGELRWTPAEMQALLEQSVEREYDFAGLRGLAAKVAEFYARHGYPFVRAVIPPQSLEGGVLRIHVIEARYGKVQAVGPDASLNAFAQAFLSPLRSGEYIESGELERVSLLLDDQPGLRVTPVMRPGASVGLGDVEVRVEPERRWNAQIGLDNHGSRYIGQWRANASASVNHVLTAADQVDARLTHSESDLWSAHLGYSLPLGTSGLRGNVSWSRTHYELGREFARLQASGQADTWTLGATYPLLRTQRANLSLSASVQHKELEDRQAAVGTHSEKSSDLVTLGAQFDRRDAWGGGGVTFGRVQWTWGELDLSAAQAAQDRASGRNTAGSFDKITYSLARLQVLPVPGVTLFGRISGQVTNDNLDSSEGFGLGGPTAVRAYPSGEAFGDEGWVVQAEVRYAVAPGWSVFGFYDHGRVSLNAQPAQLAVPVQSNNIELAGYGLGVRWNQGPWSADASVAWRSGSRVATSDPVDRNPRFWLTVSRSF